MYQPRTHRSFVSYMDRSREYYAAQGYNKPYEWAHYNDVPFTPLKKPLAELRVGLVTTAEKPKLSEVVSLEILVQRVLYAEPSNPPPQNLFTDILSWDKEATHTKDVNSFLPVNQLNEYVSSGRIGSASGRFYGVPTDYSKSKTLNDYAPRILEWCREDHVDAVILTAL